MKPAEIRDRLAALREAGAKLRARPARQTLDSLRQVLDGWSDAGSPWRRGLEEELPAATGFSAETVRAGLALGLAHWTGDALAALVARELPAPQAGALEASGFDTTAVLLAGSIPMPSLLSLLAPLVLRSPVLAKSGSRDPLTARWVQRSVAETDPELGRCLDVVDFPGEDRDCTAALLEADCVVATGSDETVASVRALLRPPRRLLAYGHRVSAAALGAEVELDRIAPALALDVALWDQLGCLSPIVVFAEPPADAVAEALARALAGLETRMPRGRVDPAARALLAHERAEAELRAAAGAQVTLHGDPSGAWTVVREREASPRPAPLHRFVRVLPVEDESGLRAGLAPLARHLAAVALAGFGARTPALSRELARLGASRVCAPGLMQAPPLGWHHDGAGVLSPLARFTDLEVSS